MREEMEIKLQMYFLDLQMEEKEAQDRNDNAGEKIARAKQEALQKTLYIVGESIEGINSKYDMKVTVAKQKDKIEFSFDFTICPVCEEKLEDGGHNRTSNIRFCPSGCCRYELDDIIDARFFNEKLYFIPWNEYQKVHGNDLEAFLKELEYWRKKRETEGWELEKSFPKLSKAILKYKEVEDDDGFNCEASIFLKQMDKIDRIRYVSMLLGYIDIPFELNYGGARHLIEFLNAVENKEEVKMFECELKELRSIVEVVESLTEVTTREHSLMQRAEKWSEKFSAKSNLLLEIVERISDERLLNQS